MIAATQRFTLTVVMIVMMLAGSPRASAQTVLLTENFDNIATLVPDGWVRTNNSGPVGLTSWQQGSSAFPAHQGSFNSYISGDFNNAGNCLCNAVVSNWLLLPVMTLQNGVQLKFWTRTRTFPLAADRLQVRMSLQGQSTNVGTGGDTVGTFTNLLLDINPTYIRNGYPSAWTEFTATVVGVPTPTSGRLAFRYFVENSGPGGINGDVIGIDTVTVVTGGTTNNCQQALPACASDIAPGSGDGNVNVADLLAVISNWGQTGPPRPLGDVAPLPNGDCTVNVSDLLAVISAWGGCQPATGACCMPSGACVVQAAVACQVGGGAYAGDGVPCASANCPQPSNDNCTGATPVAVGGSATGNLFTASFDDVFTCQGVLSTIGRWHTVTGTGQTLTASICASTGSFDGRLTVYCGADCDDLGCIVAANNNTCGSKEQVSWCSGAGNTYFILVHAQSVAENQGSYTLSVTAGGSCGSALPCGIQAPVNDDCANAVPISNGLTAFSTIGASTDGNAVAKGQCNDSDSTQTAADIWFTYTATCSGMLRVTTCEQLGGFTDYDSDIVIYTNTGMCPPPDANRIGCNDDDPVNQCGQEPPFASTATAPVTAGQSYLIRVGGFADLSDVGTGNLLITCQP